MKRLLLFLVIFFVPSVAFGQDIERAYQKEFAYLKAQKEALTQRLAELERETNQKVQTEESAIAALQNRLVSLQLEGDTLQEQLAEVERDSTRTQEHTDSLFALFEQARASLGRYEVEVAEPSDTPTPQDVRTLFTKAMPVIDDAGRVRREQGSFFLGNGQQVAGDIVHVGRIASFGVSKNAAGALAPAGDGHLKLWPGESGPTARAYAAGKTPEQVSVFLYESVEKPVEQKEQKTILGTIQAGGVVAWVIVALGALALLLAFWRFVVLMLNGTPGRVVDDIARSVAAGRYGDAARLAKSARGATARVLTKTLSVLDQSREVADDAVMEAIVRETPRIERFGTAIMVFAAVAPLLGLLGTVTGMIATFDVITEYGTGDPKMLSGGISEALITTQLGLVVAIPALLVGNLLNGRSNLLLDEMEQAALRVLNAARLDDVEPAEDPEPSRPFELALAEASG